MITKQLLREMSTPVPESGCWIWEGPYHKAAHYGRLANLFAHRVAWSVFNGPIPKGACVLHKCDVRECINPLHLFLGDRKDNMLDCIRKGRRANTRRETCAQGHNAWRQYKGRRVCVLCVRRLQNHWRKVDSRYRESHADRERHRRTQITNLRKHIVWAHYASGVAQDMTSLLNLPKIVRAVLRDVPPNS